MSLPFTAADALAWTGGRLLRGDPDANLVGVSTDTRSLEKGQLFVAIRGPVHDAHDYLQRAVAGGAAALLVERQEPVLAIEEEITAIRVPDTTAALGALAAGHRSGFSGPLVAITGSNGKTTTKEMCAAILSEAGPCLKNRGNLNNAYGLPLTLLERAAEHRAVVVEVGMNHRGEIAPLAAIARPSIAVITNAGTAHIEHLGSREEIAREKGDLVAGLGPDDTAVLNADDPLVMEQAARTRARIVSFGTDPSADVRARGAEPRAGGYGFRLECGTGSADVHVAGLGEPTVLNGLAAAAAALAAGASLAQVSAGLAHYRPAAGRMEPVALSGDRLIIDDTYNANPQSMEAALQALARLRGSGRTIAALGDMGELGESAGAAHRDVGALAAQLEIDRLFGLGAQSSALIQSAQQAGMGERARHAADCEQLIAELAELLRPGDRLLVKGSRSMRMERVVQGLVAGEERD